MNPVADLTGAWRGLARAAAGKPDAAKEFNATPPGLAIALGWLLFALILSAAAQSMAVGMPSVAQLAIGLFIQAVTVAGLALATWQTLRFLRLGVSTLALLVPVVYAMALVQIFAIPLVLLGPNVQLLAVVGLGVLIWRLGTTLGAMRSGVAIAFTVLCLMVLVVVPNALYILFSQVPSPA